MCNVLIYSAATAQSEFHIKWLRFTTVIWTELKNFANTCKYFIGISPSKVEEIFYELNTERQESAILYWLAQTTRNGPAWIFCENLIINTCLHIPTS